MEKKTPINGSAIKEENKRLKNALEQSVAGILVLDKNCDIVFANASWAEMHGYETEELLGKPMKALYTKDNYKKFQVHIKNAEKKSTTLELTQLKKDKTPISIWARILITRDTFKKPNGCVISAFDLTKQKKHEKALIQKTKELKRFNKLFIDRELKMVKLKKRIKELEGKKNQKVTTRQAPSSAKAGYTQSQTGAPHRESPEQV